MSDIDLELGSRQETVDRDDGSLCSSSDEGVSCCSHFYSTAGGSYDEYSLDPEISEEASSSSRASEEELAAELAHVKATKVERECRICHLGLHSGGGAAIQLGCSCKDDLGAAHKNCAETWFKIKGNKTCEICNSIAKNVSCVNDSESVIETEHPSTAVSAPVTQLERRRVFWQGHRFLNFLLACMVFAFVISWLFHFNVPS